MFSPPALLFDAVKLAADAVRFRSLGTRAPKRAGPSDWCCWGGRKAEVSWKWAGVAGASRDDVSGADEEHDDAIDKLLF